MEYQRRIVDDELDELFPEIAAISLDGPKAVGKTTTAEQRVRAVVRLDESEHQTLVRASPSMILDYPRPTLVDEWQRVPEVWDRIRRAIDHDPKGGQFLLAGSASPHPGSVTHSGAGRIGRMRMRPMTLAERGVEEPTVSLRALLSGTRPELRGSTDVGLKQYAEEIVASGFPGIRGFGPRGRRFHLDSYIATTVEKEIATSAAPVKRPQAMTAWLRAYAAAESTTASYTRILDAATPGQTDKPSRGAVDAYRDALTALWLLDPLPTWVPVGSTLNRLAAKPKHHLADPALSARLLGLDVRALLTGAGRVMNPGAGVALGALFEALATLSVRVSAQADEAGAGHLRTRNGDHEVDLIVERADGAVVACEVKLASSVQDSDTKHLHWLKKTIGDRLLDAIVINTGPRAYRRPDGIGVVPLALLGV